MRSIFKIALLVAYNVVFVCVLLLVAELSARKIAYGQFASPRSRTELILDRWTAFRNHPHFNINRTQVNGQGFRRVDDISLAKPPGTVRIFVLGGSVAYGGETLYPEIDEHWQFLDNNQTIDHFLELRLNSAFPGKHWQVVNAAVKGYFLNQDLSLYLSTLQRYKPDYLILLDGVNDMFEALRSGEDDGYSTAGFREEFEGLTDPDALSPRLMATTWLLNESALYRSIRESVALRHRIRARRERAAASAPHLHPELASLTADEQQHLRAAAAWIENYPHTARQIWTLARSDGTEALFFLQPEIASTRKPLTNTESRIFDYWSRLDGGAIDIYGFQNLYPQLSVRLMEDAGKQGYHAADLTSVFDHIRERTFTDYCHLTPTGNQAIANAVFDVLAGIVPSNHGAGAQ
jgi:lysophospholipase L1-like esterase